MSDIDQEVEEQEIEAADPRDGIINTVQPDGTLTTKAGADGKVGYYEWKPGTTLEEAVEFYGADLVFDFFVKHGTRNLQNGIRGHLSSGGEVETLEESLKDWRPDTTRRRSADPFGKIVKAVENMDPEEQLAYIAKLQERLAGVVQG